MHFGLFKNKNFIHSFAFILFVFAFGCKEKPAISFTIKSPELGANINLGETIDLQIDVPKDVVVDSVRYIIDNSEVGKSNGISIVKFSTANLRMGNRMITAIVSRGELKDTISSNFVLKTDQKPIQLSYKVVGTLPHDTSAYTEGLAYVDGKFLESTGEKGASKLKWVDVKTGKSLQQTQLEPQYFGEGSLKIGDKIIMLTWQENIGFVFDAKTLKQVGTFPYQSSKEGWGLAFDGKRILRSDGTNRIWYMDAKDFTEQGYLEVYNQNGPLEQINELEYVEGKIYANVYGTTKIVRIDPNTGRVEAELDLAALVPKNYFKNQYEVDNNVLNGIAWDAKGKRLFVAGKKWPKLYEIKLKETSTK